MGKVMRDINTELNNKFYENLVLVWFSYPFLFNIGR